MNLMGTDFLAEGNGGIEPENGIGPIVPIIASSYAFKGVGPRIVTFQRSLG
jgi:hypothetical protein